jgi:hypothetical protein
MQPTSKSSAADSRQYRKNMKVINIHCREYPVSSKEVGLLLDSLASKNDLLWPHHLWPRMKFDKPLSVNAAGGHGPAWKTRSVPFYGTKGF